MEGKALPRRDLAAFLGDRGLSREIEMSQGNVFLRGILFTEHDGKLSLIKRVRRKPRQPEKTWGQ